MRHVTLGDTFYFKFTTRRFSSGAPLTLAGTPVISAYEDANLTEITAGITITVDYDSRTGLNHVAVVASGANGYEAGKYYAFVITTGTVDSVSVVGETVHEIVIGPADANVTEISGDAAAADNLESYCDGTTPMPVNATQISGDATAADNLEADYDGTGYNKSNSTIGTCTTNTDMRGTDSAYTGTPPTSGAIADAVWDEPRSGHTTAGSYGQHTGDAAMRGTDGANTTAPDNTTIANIETDTQDIQSRLPASLNNGVIPADVQRVNDIEIVGDGNATPFDVP